MAISGRSWTALALLGVLGALLMAAPASGASLIAKDGKIHACYKAKGKGKGTLRVVRSAKVKCPKRWKKVAWYAAGPAGPQGEAGAPGGTGQPGSAGGTGLPGTTATATVKQLEDKVTELLSKVQSLESVLKGITNAELLAAIANTKTLCTQASTLTTQLNKVEDAFGGLSLNTVLTTLGGALNLPTLPGNLPSFSCPA
jgi:hypothetical protein